MLYGSDVEASHDFGRLVTPGHFQRVQGLVTSAEPSKLEFCTSGARSNSESNFLAPTIVKDCRGDEEVMQEEIFGPVLPIVPVKDTDAAIAFVNQREKPLALYVFSNDNATIEKVFRQTSSGAAVANDTIMHAAVSSLPFGGVGNSGQGAYHGKLSFDLFSHRKAVMVCSFAGEVANTNFRYPPYRPSQRTVLDWVITKWGPHSMAPTAIKFLIGGVVLGGCGIRNGSTSSPPPSLQWEKQ